MRVFEHVPLTDVVYYKIGGKARFVVQVSSAEDTLEAIHFLRNNNINDIRIIGLGSNLILPDSDFPGAVLLMRGEGTTFEKISKNVVKSFAGETVDELIQFSFTHSLSGLEWAGGLPSTVGGAVRGNAGAFGSEIQKSVQTIEVVSLNDPELSVQTFSKEQAAFSYRNSHFKQQPNLVIVSATFALSPATEEEMVEARKVYAENIAYRKAHHPLEYPSCGSVFKNITDPKEVEKIVTVWPDVRELSEKKWHNKVSMGYIINRLGFSGKRIGGAEVSPKHTNYISNIDHAKAEDVKALITEIQTTFEQTFGFVPEPEVVIVEA